MSQPPQGPIPVTSTNLIPPRVLATRKASVANGQATRRQSSSLDASEVGTTLRSSYDSAIRQLRSSTLVDPLQRVPTTSQILMRIESCRRQLQTLELLMETDNQRLGAMDDAAKVLLETMRLDHMLEDRCDSVEPQLLSELRSLSHPGELEPRRHRYALYVSKFPRSLLTAEQAIDVNAFSDRVQETQDQLQLLEMLQLHESQSLGSEEERLRSFEPDESASELVTHLTTHHATPITAHCVPVISTSVSVDQPTTLRLRPVWVKYFCVEEAARIQNMDGSDDQKCCALIESLLQQLSNARQQVADAEKQSESLERTLGATRDTVAESEDASRRIRDALLDSTSRCEELETMLVDSQQNERHAALRFHRLALSNLALSESLARQLIANTEEVQRGHAVEQQLKDFLVFSSQQRSALERVIHEERNAAQAERDRHTETLLERREMDEYNHDLRDEIAAKTAEIALQKAKIEMYQQTLRVDQERHHKNVHSIEVECTSLRERVVQLEAQLDVYHSTTISKGASFRAVQHQLAWEQGSSLAKQSSSKHFERASSARSSLNASVVQEEPSPRPRAQQPPRPS